MIVSTGFLPELPKEQNQATDGDWMLCSAFSSSALQSCKPPTTMLLIGNSTHTLRNYNTIKYPSELLRRNKIMLNTVWEQFHQWLRALLQGCAKVSWHLLACASRLVNTKKQCKPDVKPSKLGVFVSQELASAKNQGFWNFPPEPGLLARCCLYLWNCTI